MAKFGGISVAALVVVLFFYIPCAGAEGTMTDTAKALGKAAFSEVERRIVRDYYREKYGEPGHYDDDHDRKKHKKKKLKHAGNPQGLPPGIAMKLARGGTLPPGIAKKHIPTDLETRLPPVRDGYKRMEVDERIVLVEVATDLIVDIITEVIVKH